ncbi:hypothetical protein SOHN41_00744 [Shewanella sp. HN-41]|nr:hypothetical protein SOHN41_00744 [Shewanella sp. HN-41]
MGLFRTLQGRMVVQLIAGASPCARASIASDTILSNIS